ncbi:ABC transporter G family member 10-like [Phragmites australis]|uniref:ABC transporter G family member 10-like n=1 Tax=Phragmites australis TaxID=29695 RepID=UPI002D77BEA2|nr:ABC transporter G family member 10-like [Phragmites australis]
MSLGSKVGDGGRRRQRYRLETRALSYVLPPRASFLWGGGGGGKGVERSLLRGVTCEAPPGELVAIVGPSGAGKTTLLSVLAGSADPGRVAAGEVLVNGCPMDAARFRRVSGYVPQDDALFPTLTVEESLVYSARLRLRGGGRGRGAAEARARDLMAELGLRHVAGSRVASVSGGERRRVSIGVDLVHDPAVLLLDEPTSGLDSGSALHIVKMLRDMATAHGKTVVLTIHQPGFRILELLDRVVLLADGAVRHHGSLAFLEARLAASGHDIPAHVNVLEYAMETIDSLKPDVVVVTASTNQEKDAAAVGPVPASARRAGYANSPAAEVRILAGRFVKTVLRTPQLFAARMAQSVLAGAFLGSIFLGTTDLQSRLGFFAFSLTYVLSSTTEALPVFLQERRILERETSRGAYRVSSYVASNAAVFLPFLLAAAVLYAAPVYWLVGLAREPARFAYFSLVVWLVMLTANSFVACLSALAPNYIVGNSVVAGLIGCFFLFSGYFVASKNIPRYWVFMHYASLFKYPFEALVVNEYGGARGARECLTEAPGGGGLCVLDGAALLRQQGMRESMRWSNLGVMLGFVVGYRVLCFSFLWFRCHRIRR